MAKKDNKVPGIFFSISLILFLIIPYLTKLMVSHEPYPAIIMPSGHGKINLKDTVLINYEFEFEGVKNNRVFEIDPSKLFPEIPGRFYFGIVRNNLGFLSEEEERESYNENWQHIILPWKKNKFLKGKELKNYYIKNVAEPIDSISVIKKMVTRDIRTGILIDEKIISVETYPLK